MLSRFAPGQIWKYTTRPGEGESRIIVVRVDDDDEFGNIVHIYVSEVAIPNANAPDGQTTFVGHMPFSEEALDQSVENLEAEHHELPDYEPGYRLWREAFENGEAGIFTVSVAEGIDFIQHALSD